MAGATHRMRDAIQKVAVPFAASKPGGWLFCNVLYRIDLPLMRLSKGRARLGFFMPHAVLTTTGARTGEARSRPLLFTRDGDRVILIASNGGSSRHPGWYHNLLANPSATVEIDGVPITCTAREAEDEERARLWAGAAASYPGYDTYQARAGRRIPVMVLEPT